MDKKGTHSVKNLAEKVTMISVLTSGQVGKKTSERVNRSFAVPLKVRFLAMTMFE